MVVCPVCEHAQEGGLECEVCGHPLHTSRAAALAIPPLEGLEPTLQPSVPGAAGEAVPGLEPTHLPAPGAAPPPEAFPGLEPTTNAPVDAAVEPLADVERVGDGGPGDEPTPVPAVAVCRYCRTPAASGERLCSRCGMRLPTANRPAPAARGEEVERICSCGTPLRGPLCPSCGARAG